MIRTETRGSGVDPTRPLACVATAIPLLLGSIGLTAAEAHAQVDEGWPIVQAMYERYNAGDFDAMFAHYATDVVFEDPTIGMRLEGRQPMKQAFAGANEISAGFEWRIQHHFTSGGWTVVAGEFESSLDGSKVGAPDEAIGATIPFASMFEVRDGKIVRHFDFVDYDSWDEANPQFPVPARRTKISHDRLRERARAYMRATNAQPPDVDALIANYGDSIIFTDPTFGLGVRGRDRMRAGIEQFAVPNRAYDPHSEYHEYWVSGTFIVIRGTYSQLVNPHEEARASMDFITAFRVGEHGLFDRQWDFYDKDRFEAEKHTAG